VQSNYIILCIQFLDATRMKAAKKVTSAVVVAAVALSLQGCFEEKVQELKNWAQQKFDDGIYASCEQMVAGQVDEAILAAYKELGTACDSDNAYSTKDECMGYGMSALMTAEEESKAKFTTECVAKVNELISDAGTNMAAIWQYTQDWWDENGDSVKGAVATSFEAAKDAAGGAVSSSKDASITFMCDKLVESEIDKAIIQAKNDLVSKCKDSDVDEALCESTGGAQMDDFVIAEKAKWDAECVNNLQSVLTFKHIEDVGAALTQWWNNHGSAMLAEVKTFSDSTISSAVKETQSRMLRFAQKFGMTTIAGLSQKFGVATIAAAAGCIGLMTVLVGALVVRLRRSRATRDSSLEVEEGVE